MDDETAVRFGSFRDAIVVPLSQTDAEKWPIRSGRVVKLVAADLAGEFFDDLARLRAEGWTSQQLADLFGNPSRLWRIAHHLINGLRAGGADIEAQRAGVLELIELIDVMKAGSAFCETGANVVLTDEQIQSLVRLSGDEADPGERTTSPRVAHRCAGALWSCAEAMYFVAHELGVEIHGPYTLEDGGKLLVRDFFRLQPNELWPQAVEGGLDFDQLRIAVTYDRFEGWFDVYNNLYLDPGFHLLPCTTAVAAWRDGERLGGAELESVCDSAGSAIEAIVGQVEGWTLVEVARKYVEVLWWRKRELALAARGDWRPSSRVLEKVTAEALPPASSRNPTIEALRAEFDLSLDPAG